MERYHFKQSLTKNRMLKFFFIFITIIILYTVYTAYAIWSYGQKIEPQQADAAIILGAATLDGAPSPVLKGRIDHAVMLYHHKKVEKLIFTGGSGERGEISEAEAAQRYAMDHGVKADDIMIETSSTITEENLWNAKIVAEQNGISTYLIVSDPLHMKRAMMISQDMDMNAYSSPSKYSAYQSLCTKLPFLAREVFFYIGYQVVSPFR